MKRLWTTGFGVLFGLALILATVSWTSYTASSDRIEARTREAHTKDVLAEAQKSLSALQDAETGQRGYIITGRTDFLEPYEIGRANLYSSLERLADLTLDNPDQMVRIGELRMAVAAKLAELAETIVLMHARDQPGAIAIVSSGIGKDRMNAARAVLAAISAEEDRLLVTRHSALIAAAERERLMTFSLIAVGVVMLLAAIVATIRAVLSIERGKLSQAAVASEARLRLFVDRAPAAIAMFDTKMRYLATNQRFLEDYGLNEAAGAAALIGRGHYEIFPEIPERWRDIHAAVMAGGSLSSQDDSFLRMDGHIEWVRWEMVPWHQTDGTVGGAMLFSEVVTARKQAELRRAFMLDFAESLAAAPHDGTASAVALLGRHLGVSRAGYGDVDTAELQVAVVHEYTEGAVRSTVGTHRLAAFGRQIVHDLLAGRTLVVEDVTTDPRTQATSDAYLAVGNRSLLVVPILADGCLRATLHLGHHSPRVWTPDDVQLAQDVSTRIWSAAEQVRVKDALAETAEEFQTLADGIPTLCWMAEPDGHIYWYNKGWYDYTGTVAADMKGWGWQSVHDPEVLPSVMRRWGASLSAGVPFEMTFPLRGADGVFRPFMTRVAPVRGDDGKVRRWLGVNTDVTEAAEREATLHHVANALRDSENRLQLIFDTAPVGFLIGEAPSGRLIAGNPQADAMFHQPMIYEGSEDRYLDLVTCHPDGRRVEPAEFPMTRALAGEARPELEVLQYHRDGTQTWMRFIAAPIRTDGRITGAMVAVLDIDRKMRAMQALSEIRNDLERRVTEEVEAREAAQVRLIQAEKLTALGQLAGGIAHDFNNVLQAVSGGTVLIRRHADDPEAVKRFGAMVEHAARRGASVTRRLLSFARRDELRAEPVVVPVLLEGLHEILTHTLGAGVMVQLDLEPGLSLVLADRGQLETVLVNLATNARDAMPDGGAIIISARAETVSQDAHPSGLAPGDYVRMAVADTGLGMDATLLARVVEPFFTTKEAGKGTGLGLPMARSFAEQSGGALSIASEPGRGTIVTIWLPVTSARTESEVLADIVTFTEGQREPRILLVDDDDMVRELLADELTDRGYDVLQAECGADAISLLDLGEAVDLIVSDLSMPGMDGVMVIREAQARRPRLPAILLTGYAGDAATLAVGAAIVGSFSLLRKPITGAQLTDRVETMLEAMLVP